jgi:parallel beta-helix repeat protein
MIKFYSKKTFVFVAFVLILCIPIAALAQSTVLSTTSTFLNNNGSGTVIFNFQNTNSYPIKITGIAGITGVAGAATCDVYYNTTPITVQPTAISNATGWFVAMSGSFTGVANTSTTVTQPFITGGSFVIPPNTTYGFAVYATSQRYFSITATGTVTISAGGCNIITGAGIGYAGGIPPAQPVNNSRGWVGSITFEPYSGMGYNNAGVSELIAPKLFNPGNRDISVRVRNFGKNQLSHVDVNWTLDGVLQTPIAFNGILDTVNGVGAVDTAVTLGNVLFTSVGKSLVAWTSSPNYLTDTSNTNDTLRAVLRPSLNGVYTIGGSAPDYATITAATNDLNSFGVSGPVTFNIRNGIYNEQISLNSVAGVSATNRITFQSELLNKNNVTLNYSSTGTGNAVVNLSGISYVTIRALTLNQTNTTASAGISITGSCNADTIIDCTIFTAATSTSGTYAAYIASATNNGIVIKNNTITGGYYGLYLYGSGTTALISNSIVDGNTITGAYYYTVYCYYTNNTKFKNNIVTLSSTASTTHYLATFGYSDNALEVTGNKFLANGLSATLYGVRIYYCDGTTGTPGLIANNSMYFQTSGTLYGLYSYYSSYQNYYNNTVIGNSSGATNYPTYIYHTSSTYTNINYRNNIFANMGTTGYAWYVYDPTYINSDYNLFYTNSTTFGYKVLATATAYPTFNAYRLAYPTQDINSVYYRPSYTNAINLAPNLADSVTWMINGRGVHIAGMNTDINGNPRSVSPSTGAPDLGAFEITPTGIPPMAVPNMAPTAGSTQVFMLGTDTVATVSYPLSSTPPSTLSVLYYTGVIHPQLSASQNFTYAYAVATPSASGNYQFDFNMYYKDPMIGNIANESNLRSATYDNSTNYWAINTGTNSAVDVIRNVISTPNTSLFGTFIGTDNQSPLPIKLTSFEAKSNQKDANISWATSSEKNSSHFELMRSIDGEKFEVVAQIKASGNSNKQVKYNFVDAGILSHNTNIYYQLKSIDLNGTFIFSNIVQVGSANSIEEFSVYPNPFNDKLHLTIPAKTTVTVTLFDYQGMQLSKYPYDAASLRTETIDDLNELKAGIYFIKIDYNGTVKTLKLLK